MVILNVTAIHSHPRYWGPDSLIWRPSRWIISNHTPAISTDSFVNTSLKITNEKLMEPQPGTFFPWSDGPRVCPGKQYAQVEFVAVISALLRNYRVDPVPLAREDSQGARKRFLATLADCQFNMTLHMKNPEIVAVTWTRRWVEGESIWRAKFYSCFYFICFFLRKKIPGSRRERMSVPSKGEIHLSSQDEISSHLFFWNHKILYRDRFNFQLTTNVFKQVPSYLNGQFFCLKLAKPVLRGSTRKIIGVVYTKK